MPRTFLIMAGMLSFLGLIVISLGSRVTAGEETPTGRPLNPILETATCTASEACFSLGKTQAAIEQLTYAPTFESEQTSLALTRQARGTVETRQTMLVGETATAQDQLTRTPLNPDMKTAT